MTKALDLGCGVSQKNTFGGVEVYVIDVHEQRGFAQMHFLHRYHLCVQRGHMSPEKFPGG